MVFGEYDGMDFIGGERQLHLKTSGSIGQEKNSLVSPQQKATESSTTLHTPCAHTNEALDLTILSSLSSKVLSGCEPR